MALFNKRFSKLLFLIVFVNTLVILLVSNGKWMDDSSAERVSPINVSDYWRLPPKIKSILFWNAPRRAEMTIFGTGHDTFVQHGCPVSDCEIVNSPHQYPGRPLDSYDAIVFNFNDEFWLTKKPIFNRRPHQRFIFFTQEPPPSLKPLNISRYRNYFNWTMTYRMDSGVRFLYGRILPKPSAPKTSQEIEARIRESTQQLTLNRRCSKWPVRGSAISAENCIKLIKRLKRTHRWLHVRIPPVITTAPYTVIRKRNKTCHQIAHLIYWICCLMAIQKTKIDLTLNNNIFW
jgi:hypothetical protein